MKLALAALAMIALVAAGPTARVDSTKCQTVTVHGAARSLVTMRSLDGMHVVQIETKKVATRTVDILPATTYAYEIRSGSSVSPGAIVATGRVTVALCRKGG